MTTHDDFPARLATRDPLAVEELFRSIESVARRIAKGSTGTEESVDDIVQDVMLQILHRAQADATWITTVHANNLLAPLVERMIRNRIIDLRRQMRGKATESLTRSDENLPDDDASIAPDSQLLKRDLDDAVAAALSSLPDDYRALIRLRLLSEKSLDEISSELQLPPQTVRVRYYRSIELLRNLIRRHMADTQ